MMAPFRTRRRPLLLLCSLILLQGCKANAEHTIETALAEDFQLRVGESAMVASAGVLIGFESVSSDSRCGKGEVCIWEGDAVVRIWLQNSAGEKLLRELHTAQREANSAEFGAYSVRLIAVMPPAFAGISIAQSDYIATLRVVRGSADGDGIY